MNRKLIVLIIAVLAVTLLAVPVSLAGASAADATALWHLDGDANDSIGGFHGAIYGATVTDGKYDSALNFDGDDYVELPPADQLFSGDEFTVHLWFRTAVDHGPYGQGEGRLVNFHRIANPGATSISALALYVEQGEVGLLYYNESGTHVWETSPAAYDDNNWHSLAVTHGAAGWAFYYDGLLAGANTDTFSDFGDMNALLGSYDAVSRFYTGDLDEIGIWNRALTAQEIADIHNPPAVTMPEFSIKNALIKFYAEDDDDRINIQGTLKLDLVNGNGVDISEPVTVTIGTLTETFQMTEKGRKNNKRWEYKRPNHGTGDIKSLTINWKTGKFTIKADKADLTGMNDPSSVLIGVKIGNDDGQTYLSMREKKQWQYNSSNSRRN